MANKPSYLCRRCRTAMCDDCLNMSEEYEELNKRLKAALWEAEARLKTVQALELKVKHAEARAADWERLMKLGQHKIILAWIEAQKLPDLVRAVEGVKAT